jgi:hypothetical protein
MLSSLGGSATLFSMVSIRPSIQKYAIRNSNVPWHIVSGESAVYKEPPGETNSKIEDERSI